MAPRAYIARDCVGQVRFKLPTRRRDLAYFKRAETRLADCPLVTEVATNAMTGSILVHHGGSIEAIADYARRAELFELAERPHRVPPRPASTGEFDVAVLFIGLYLGLGLFQLVRGRILAPATTLLWIAAQMVEARASHRAAAATAAED